MQTIIHDLIYRYKCSNKNCKAHTWFYSFKLDKYVCSEKCLEVLEREDTEESVIKWEG